MRIEQNALIYIRKQISMAEVALDKKLNEQGNVYVIASRKQRLAIYQYANEKGVKIGRKKVEFFWFSSSIMRSVIDIESSLKKITKCSLHITHLRI